MLVANQIVSPIVIGEGNTKRGYNINGNVLGTCFSIRDNYCLTAGHVINDINARPAGTVALIGMAQEQIWAGAEVLDSEILDADIGVLKYALADNHHDLPTMSWDLSNLPVLAKVITVGYPYGSYTSDDEHSILARAFQGHVVCTIPRFRPIGTTGPAFSIHELSFMAPRGLSGAPLLSENDPSRVKGIILGNKQTDMRIYSEIEKESDGDSVLKVEHFEFLYLGVAVRAIHIASLKSSLLGGTVGEHLKNNGLIADPCA